jgi:hypothetical protein
MIATQPAMLFSWGFVRSICLAVTKAPIYQSAKLVPIELVRRSLRRPRRSMKKEREMIVATVLTAAYMPVHLISIHTSPRFNRSFLKGKNTTRNKINVPEANKTTFVPLNPILLNTVGV